MLSYSDARLQANSIVPRASRARRPGVGRRNRVSARLSGRLQPRRHRAARQGRRHRRLAQEPGHRRLHLREGPQVRRARLRPRSPALPGRPQGPQGRRASSSACRGTKRSSSSPTRFEQAKADVRRRVDPAVLVRRIERPADAGQPRRAAVAAVRHVAAGAHGVRGADRRGEHGALRQDAVGHLPGLSGRAADRPVGREPVGVRHSSRPVRARGAEARREAGRRSIRARRRSRGRPTCTSPVKPGTDVAVALAIHRYLFANGYADEAFLREHTRGADTLRERAEPWTIERAAGRRRHRRGGARAGRGALRDERRRR